MTDMDLLLEALDTGRDVDSLTAHLGLYVAGETSTLPATTHPAWPQVPVETVTAFVAKVPMTKNLTLLGDVDWTSAQARALADLLPGRYGRALSLRLLGSPNVDEPTGRMILDRALAGVRDPQIVLEHTSTLTFNLLPGWLIAELAELVSDEQFLVLPWNPHVPTDVLLDRCLTSQAVRHDAVRALLRRDLDASQRTRLVEALQDDLAQDSAASAAADAQRRAAITWLTTPEDLDEVLKVCVATGHEVMPLEAHLKVLPSLADLDHTPGGLGEQAVVSYLLDLIGDYDPRRDAHQGAAQGAGEVADPVREMSELAAQVLLSRFTKPTLDQVRDAEYVLTYHRLTSRRSSERFSRPLVQQTYFALMSQLAATVVDAMLAGHPAAFDLLRTSDLNMTDAQRTVLADSVSWDLIVDHPEAPDILRPYVNATYQRAGVPGCAALQALLTGFTGTLPQAVEVAVTATLANTSGPSLHTAVGDHPDLR